MATFPGGIFSWITVVDNVDNVLATHPNSLAAEIIAEQTKIGVDNSVVSETLDYFLKHASGAYRTHQHDGTSDDGAKLDWDSCWTDAVHDHSSSAEGGIIFVSGDWIISSVTTTHTGWTNVSSTYSNKFMRINATPLTTGGADTHTTPSHTLTAAEMPAHTHTVQYAGELSYPNYAHRGGSLEGTFASGSAGGGGGHTHDAANNVPAYVQVVVFQKD